MCTLFWELAELLKHWISQIYVCQTVNSIQHNIGILNSLAWWCIYMQKNTGVYTEQ